VVIAFVFGYIDVDAGRWLLLEGKVDVCFLVWGQMCLLCIGIEVVVL
jgi:hypothetical protein